jgi:hypothetical protein
MKTLSILSLFALLTLGASAAGVPRIPFTVNFAITAVSQNSNTTTTSTTVTVPAFTKSTITTKSLLPLIAQDEFAKTNYGASTFPAGAKLVFLANPLSFEDSEYVVEDKDGNILVHVSDLLTLAPENDVVANSYVQTIATGIYKTLTTEYIAVVVFDDSSAGGTTKFAISYSLDATTTQTLSSKGVFSESANSKLGAASGTASLNGVPAVLTAPAQTLSGKVTVAF